MLEVGNGELTFEENKAHFSLWCILAAPLMLGNDLRTMTPETLAILTNKEVIAVNQDPLGRQGRKVRDDGDFEVWSKELHDGTRAVILFNRSKQDAGMQFRWAEVGIPQRLEMTVTDLWDTTKSAKYRGSFSSVVPAHGVVMVAVE